MLRVAINAEITSIGQNGGLETVLIGLLSALAEQHHIDQRYVIIGSRENPNWLRPYLGENQELVFRPLGRASLPRKVKSLLRPANPPSPTIPPISSGFYESLGCDVIHFPYQHFAISSLPSVYTPHDLQHLHYPQFFSPYEIARREAMFRTGCQLSKKVTVGSDWVKQDILNSYGIHPSRVDVIPWAPPTQVYKAPSEGTVSSVLQRFDLTPGFALYPAVTWPHKNHIRLLEAVASVRDQHGIVISLVCTGSKTPFFADLETKLRELGLAEQVTFLGMIPGEDLRALYRSARFVIVPTLFEAASGPMYEAWHDGAPVAASTATSLPEQAGDAALLFDPLSVEAIADALVRMHRDETLRRELVALGKKRLKSFTWQKTAKEYADVYTQVAGI
jgi:glycosyltransferase involved in cell wall biosynthesis